MSIIHRRRLLLLFNGTREKLYNGDKIDNETLIENAMISKYTMCNIEKKDNINNTDQSRYFF
jgi:hypothetical protein